MSFINELKNEISKNFENLQNSDTNDPNAILAQIKEIEKQAKEMKKAAKEAEKAAKRAQVVPVFDEDYIPEKGKAPIKMFKLYYADKDGNKEKYPFLSVPFSKVKKIVEHIEDAKLFLEYVEASKESENK